MKINLLVTEKSYFLKNRLQNFPNYHTIPKNRIGLKILENKLGVGNGEKSVFMFFHLKNRIEKI